MNSYPQNIDIAATLASLGIPDAARAERQLREMAGNGVTDEDLLPLYAALFHALEEAPDPDRALSGFTRWFGAVGTPYSHLQTLLHHPIALQIFCLVAGSSQYFSDLLVRNPEYFEIVANPGMRGGTKTANQFQQELSGLLGACRRPELKRDVLRRWKAREMLRIGTRDLIGLADMPSTAFEFSNLADSCVQAALEITYELHPLQPPAGAIPFAVLGMGKLGGRELNYSSDIDLMFLHSDDLPLEVVRADGRKVDTLVWLTRVGETLIKTLSEETAQGHVFRVDMRLRPEGRFGALTRSLSAFRAYYESWAEIWEYQALLKVRCIAGDRELGEAFRAMSEPFVYRRHVSGEFLEAIRANKRRIEQKCNLEGETETNVKTGFGGIRDVEFLAQFLQLQFGGEREALRSANSLTALQRLAEAKLLTEPEYLQLADDYQFLRTLEHRLQLLHGFQTQTMPLRSDVSERRLLARRMGFADLESFETELDRRRTRTNLSLQRYVFGMGTATSPSISNPTDWQDIGELLDNLDSPKVQEALVTRLTAAGFQNIPKAIQSLTLPIEGNAFGGMPPDTPIEFKEIAPDLLRLLQASPDPDAGLAGIEELATAVPNRAHLYASFADSPEIMTKAVTLAAASPPLMQRLVRHLEWMETLFGNAPARRYEAEFLQRLNSLKTPAKQLQALARLYLRETLCIGAREVWKEAEVSQTMADLTHLTEFILEQLLRFAMTEPTDGCKIAVIGLGKLGGAELGYASDWDVVFVYEASTLSNAFDLANGIVERVLASAKKLGDFGATIEVDIRLRPWGRKGALIYSPEGYVEYLQTSAETWERQAALKARFIAGDKELGEKLVAILHAESYTHGLSVEGAEAVVAMKQRIETERLKFDERDTNLKLGYGGLTDIEWLAQKYQLLHGNAYPLLREPNTLQAIQKMQTIGLLNPAEVATLTETYLLLSQIRNGLWLLSGHCHDVLMAGSYLHILSKQFSYESPEALKNYVALKKAEARRLFLRHFHSAEQP